MKNLIFWWQKMEEIVWEKNRQYFTPPPPRWFWFSVMRIQLIPNLSVKKWKKIRKIRSVDGSEKNLHWTVRSFWSFRGWDHCRIFCILFLLKNVILISFQIAFSKTKDFREYCTKRSLICFWVVLFQNKSLIIVSLLPHQVRNIKWLGYNWAVRLSHGTTLYDFIIKTIQCRRSEMWLLQIAFSRGIESGPLFLECEIVTVRGSTSSLANFFFFSKRNVHFQHSKLRTTLSATIISGKNWEKG